MGCRSSRLSAAMVLPCCTIKKQTPVKLILNRHLWHFLYIHDTNPVLDSAANSQREGFSWTKSYHSCDAYTLWYELRPWPRLCHVDWCTTRLCLTRSLVEFLRSDHVACSVFDVELSFLFPWSSKSTLRFPYISYTSMMSSSELLISSSFFTFSSDYPKRIIWGFFSVSDLNDPLLL